MSMAMEQCGIKVAVRARPLNSREVDLDCPVVVSMQDKTVTVQCPDRGPKHFTYDFVYNSIIGDDPRSATQTNIFDEIGSAMLTHAIDGFNGTLFAYGQTGSGKSYTMMGPPEDYGVIPRMIDVLFQRKAELEKDKAQELQVWVSYIEIYKEQLLDLFNTVDKPEQVKIMEHPKLGVYVRGCQEVPCETKEDMMTNLDFGLKKRSMAATNMNQTSSRSHAVFCIRTATLEGAAPPVGRRPSRVAKDERKALHAKINLIDLAGSERTNKSGTEGERFKEGNAINQSLSALGIVIKTLAEEKAAKAAFRASKLTFLLKDSLAGNSRTYMMAAISPASDNIDETLSTLRFASSVKTIKTVPVQNKDKKDQLIDSLQEEMKLLKAQLAVGGINSAEAMEQLGERERLIKERLQMDYQEDLKVARELQKARAAALEKNGLSQHHITQAFGISSGTPYLVNMSFDPLLAGCLIYLIKESSPTTIGAHADNTLVLDTVGVPDFLCRIDYAAKTGVTIRRLGDAGRVRINGKLLKPDEELPVRHGDKVCLGRSSVLKLVRPDAGEGGEGASGPLDVQDLVLEGEGDAEMAASLENSPSWASLEMYVDQVMRQMPKDAAASFLGEMKMACRHTDEANELTSEFRVGDGLHFEVDVTSSVPPCVVVRVLHLPEGRDPQDETAWQTRYLWTERQLAERLERMRDFCGATKLYGRTELDPLEDPWCEAEPMRISQRLRNLSTVAEEMYNSMQEALGRSATLRTDWSVLRLFFGFWKSSVSAWKHERKVAGVSGGDKSAAGRLGLVKANANGKMRTTIVPQTARRKTLKSAEAASPRERPPEEAPRRKPTVKQRPQVQFSEPKEEKARGSVSSQASAVAPEEARKGSVSPRGAGAADEALRKELASATQAARKAEARALRASQENEALERRLKDKQEHIDRLNNQLEVAWQLSSVLRDQLMAARARSTEPPAPPTGTAEAITPEPPLPDVVSTAEALAAAVRGVTAAARAAQERRAASSERGHSPWTSPRRYVVVPPHLPGTYTPVAWCATPPRQHSALVWATPPRQRCWGGVVG